MERTMRKYAVRVERNEINPHVRYDGQTSGLILDPLRDEVPLEIMGFGIYRLGSNLITRETKRRRWSLFHRRENSKPKSMERSFTEGESAAPSPWDPESQMPLPSTFLATQSWYPRKR